MRNSASGFSSLCPLLINPFKDLIILSTDEEVVGVYHDTSVDDYHSDTDGLELNRQTITGEYDIYFKVLIEQAAGRQLSEDEYFPKYLKAHIDRGALILESRYKHAGSLDRYILEALGVGDTV